MNIKKLNKYDIKKVSVAFSPMWILFLFIFALAIYGWAIGDAIVFLYFGVVALVILLPFFVPVANMLLLFKIEEFHDFISTLIGISGDANTLSIVSFISIVYVIISVFVIIMTILAIIVIHWQRIETQLFAGLTPFVKRDSSEKIAQIQWIDKNNQPKIMGTGTTITVIVLIVAIIIIFVFIVIATSPTPEQQQWVLDNFG